MPDESTRRHFRLSGGDRAASLARPGRQCQIFQGPLNIGDVVLSELLEAGHALAGGLRNGAFGTCRDTEAQYVDGSPTDRLVYVFLILAGLAILIAGKRHMGQLLSKNWAIVLFFSSKREECSAVKSQLRDRYVFHR
jgi:hypothetical protein